MSEVCNEPDVNRSYFVSYVLEEQARRGHDLRVLDFGCGDGELVRLLREEGVDAYGADVFYEGASYDSVLSSPLYKEGRLATIENDSIPFESDLFDLVISDQVFEHIEDFAPSLKEIDRVLRPDGASYHHFPSSKVLREGHIGIPLAHRLPRNRLRFAYVLALRSLGVGKFKVPELSARQWTVARLQWIDEYCFYKPYNEVMLALNELFFVKHEEMRYCSYRAGRRSLLGSVLQVRVVQPFARRAFMRLAFMAVRLEPRSGPRPVGLEKRRHIGGGSGE